jgi:hypothetical protein
MAIIRASDLIERLQAIIQEEGDLPVGVADEYGDYVSPDMIETTNAAEDITDDLHPQFILICKYV